MAAVSRSVLERVTCIGQFRGTFPARVWCQTIQFETADLACKRGGVVSTSIRLLHCEVAFHSRISDQRLL
jgi:hypothetical protein